VNMHVMIDVNTKLTVTVGSHTRQSPRLPGPPRLGVDRQCHGATVKADGGYQSNPANGRPLSSWKHHLNTVHKRVRARVEHALPHMKTWNILRNCRRKRDGLSYATAVSLRCANSP
jgi:hypothetical protein